MLKTKAERDAQFERIIWRLAAKKGLTFQEAAGLLMERLVISNFGKTMGGIVGEKGSRDPNPYSYEGRTCVCALCGTKTRLDGTDCLSVITSTPHVPWEMMVNQTWSRGHEVCRACIDQLPDNWRKLFDPPEFKKQDAEQ